MGKWSQQQKCFAYLAAVLVVSLVLSLLTLVEVRLMLLVGGLPMWLAYALADGHEVSPAFGLLSFAMIFVFLTPLTLPTLGALAPTKEKAYFRLVGQFVVLVLYFLANAFPLFGPR